MKTFKLILFVWVYWIERGKENSTKQKQKLFIKIVQTIKKGISAPGNALVDFAIFKVNQLKLYIYFLIINYSAVGGKVRGVNGFFLYIF